MARHLRSVHGWARAPHALTREGRLARLVQIACNERNGATIRAEPGPDSDGLVSVNACKEGPPR